MSLISVRNSLLWSLSAIPTNESSPLMEEALLKVTSYDLPVKTNLTFKQKYFFDFVEQIARLLNLSTGWKSSYTV